MPLLADIKKPHIMIYELGSTDYILEHYFANRGMYKTFDECKTLNDFRTSLQQRRKLAGDIDELLFKFTTLHKTQIAEKFFAVVVDDLKSYINEVAPSLEFDVKFVYRSDDLAIHFEMPNERSKNTINLKIAKCYDHQQYQTQRKFRTDEEREGLMEERENTLPIENICSYSSNISLDNARTLVTAHATSWCATQLYYGSLLNVAIMHVAAMNWYLGYIVAQIEKSMNFEISKFESHIKTLERQNWNNSYLKTGRFFLFNKNYSTLEMVEIEKVNRKTVNTTCGKRLKIEDLYQSHSKYQKVLDLMKVGTKFEQPELYNEQNTKCMHVVVLDKKKNNISCNIFVKDPLGQIQGTRSFDGTITQFLKDWVDVKKATITY